ncbi:hypothetical protein LPB136_03095 [Tenacibaculum todarodis]|uniref:Uncharacterized protein n=1 Tax=Tenacibaculum todarodis TaxID=1850252 RepID=A0A1L3JGZ8_9FLAO|nr:hypothetical protein [Tenacibaculum todarodis]APG64411.1 hypothetical protein LPB136_03095 [Tenacibaculum todarodis]
MREKVIKIVFIVSLIMMIVNLLSINIDKIADFKVNKSPYLGAVSMGFVALGMFLSLKNLKKQSNK